MAPETPNTKFLPTVKGPASDYGGSDVDEALVNAALPSALESQPQFSYQDEDAGTDYGSVFDSEGEEEIARILAEVDVIHVVTEPIIEDENESGRKCLAYVPNVSRSSQVSDSGRTRTASWHTARESNGSKRAAIDVEVEEDVFDDGYLELADFAKAEDGQHNGQRPSLFPRAESVPQAEGIADQEAEMVEAEVEVEDDTLQGPVKKRQTEIENVADLTPIERFRRPPKKPLSVTDIVSPAWCEIQYWYSLTKFGKIKRTPAMRQGSKVHKELEEQVHTYVEIEVKTREDTFGLRIWNIIQSLRTLRQTGLTRELEIWGVLDGEVINGVIDELSHECPDPELEASIELSTQQTKPPPGQRTISLLYASQGKPRSAWLSNPHQSPKIYITDIKTRAGKYMPKGDALRGTQMQLMLYHKLLTELASNSVNADVIFKRYNMKPHEPFTASFIGGISELDDNFLHEETVDNNVAHFNTITQQFNELAEHNSLTRLWSLMITEFQRTIPTPSTLSPILQVEYRKGLDGKVMGNQCFVYDDVILGRYVSKTMDWWLGRRPAKGVEIEEAYKCQACDFAAECTWRAEKVVEGVRRAREKKRVQERKWKV